MKMVMLLALACFSIGCVSQRDVEVEMTSVQLIRIDTLYRYNDPIKVLTWRDERNTQFTSVANLREHYNVGVRMAVLRQR